VSVSRLQLALGQMKFARDYTQRFLNDLPAAEWFAMPSGVTHIAWQVGHLAFAEYRLALERMRGRKPEDEALIPEVYFTLFGKGSVPDPDPSKYPPLANVRAVFDRVHEQAMGEVARLPDDDLDNPVLKEHALVKTKIECLLYCPQHEMLHAGQIALVRRLLGHGPVW
jgi:hypothetical protein